MLGNCTPTDTSSGVSRCLLYALDTINLLAKVHVEAADATITLKGKRVIVLVKTLFMSCRLKHDTL